MISKFEKTHRNIINIGMKLMMEEGFQNVSINKICDAVNIARPTFYSHFNSKESLIAQYYEFAYLFSAETQHWIFSAISNWESILRLQMAYIQNTSDLRHVDLISRYLTYKLTSKEERTTITFSQEFDDKVRTTLFSLIKKAQESGEIRNTSDPHHLCDSIMNLQLGSLFSWCASGGNYDVERSIFWNLEAILMVQPEYRGIWKYYYTCQIPGLVPRELS